MRETAERYEGLAETYALYRPDYPAEAFADLVAACRTEKRIAVDVGAGPGLATRQLRAALPADWLLTAIEPGHDMRRVLGRTFRGELGVQVIDAIAEALPLPAGSAGLVVACDAVHWFERAPFLVEAERVLAPGGVLGFVRNRTVAQPVTEAFDGYIARHYDRGRDYGFDVREKRREPSVRELGQLTAFRTPHSQTYRWSRQYETRGLIDLYLTRSGVWSIVRRVGLGPVLADLSAIAAEIGEGPWEIGYATAVKWVQRR